MSLVAVKHNTYINENTEVDIDLIKLLLFSQTYIILRYTEEGRGI